MGRKKGGNRRYKGRGSNYTASSTKTILRKAIEEGEIYACVTKLYGNGMADVICNDGISRMLIIRNKFRGKNRRDNTIKIGSVVLAGLRMWEVVGLKKKSKADLLEIYSAANIHQLKKLDGFNELILPDALQSVVEQKEGYDHNKKAHYEDNEKLVVKEDLSKKTDIGENSGGFNFDDI
jgi:initiation factor 1A